MEIAGTLSKYWCKSLKLQKKKSQSENFNSWIVGGTNYVGSSIQESLSKAPQCKQMQIEQNFKPTIRSWRLASPLSSLPRWLRPFSAKWVKTSVEIVNMEACLKRWRCWEAKVGDLPSKRKMMKPRPGISVRCDFWGRQRCNQPVCLVISVWCAQDARLTHWRSVCETLSTDSHVLIRSCHLINIFTHLVILSR